MAKNVKTLVSNSRWALLLNDMFFNSFSITSIIGTAFSKSYIFAGSKVHIPLDTKPWFVHV
jgi:hypothetical protein